METPPPHSSPCARQVTVPPWNGIVHTVLSPFLCHSWQSSGTPFGEKGPAMWTWLSWMPYCATVALQRVVVTSSVPRQWCLD